jgi:tripartite-type tricarboxylate transporter receptor subunit TctC
VTRFHDDLANVLGDPWVRERMASMGVELTVGSSAALGQFVKAELTRWGEVVQRYNIKAE